MRKQNSVPFAFQATTVGFKNIFLMNCGVYYNIQHVNCYTAKKIKENEQEVL